jgi:cysteine sulfinate desulfinase/cysteine desulfurase-like protein
MVGEDRAERAVRISIGELTTLEDVELALSAFKNVLGRSPHSQH